MELYIDKRKVTSTIINEEEYYHYCICSLHVTQMFRDVVVYRKRKTTTTTNTIYIYTQLDTEHELDVCRPIGIKQTRLKNICE